jgi:hypothetical protein
MYVGQTSWRPFNRRLGMRRAVGDKFTHVLVHAA